MATANKFSAGEFTGTIGLPLPSTEIAIRDDDGNDLPLGEVGEICIRGPQVMAGYWNRPDETAKVMTKDGFFNSGDMGFMDEQRLRQDRRPQEGHDPGLRLQGLSRTSWRTWSPSIPGVLEVAAIGVPDEHSGEVPKLFVVKKDPSADRRRPGRLLQGEPHRLQAAEVTSSSAPNCRRRPSARSCGEPCGTRRDLERRHGHRRDSG